MAENTSTGTLSGSQKNDPITAIVKGVVDIGNNLVNNLFNRAKVKKELELKAQEQKYKQLLSTLGNEQQYILQQQLNNAKTETERLQLLESAVSQIKIAQIQSASSSQNKTALIALGSAFALIAAIYVINKID